MPQPHVQFEASLHWNCLSQIPWQSANKTGAIPDQFEANIANFLKKTTNFVFATLHKFLEVALIWKHLISSGNTEKNKQACQSTETLDSQFVDKRMRACRVAPHAHARLLACPICRSNYVIYNSDSCNQSFSKRNNLTSN